MAVLIAWTLVCWRLSLAETAASVRASAACYRGSKNIGVVAVIIAKLELCDVEGQIFAAYLVVGANNAALHDRPEAFNRICVNGTHNIVSRALADHLMRILSAKQPIARVFVCGEQAHLVRYGLANETVQCRGVRGIDDTRDDIPLAANCTDDRMLAGADTAGTSVALIAMLVRGFTANVGFVHFDDAHELTEFLGLQGRALAMANGPSGLVRAESHEAVNLPRTHSLLAGQHQVNDLEPVTQINFRVLENRADKTRKTIRATLAAIRAFPFEFHGLKLIDVLRAASRAANAARPAASDQIVVASFLVRKHLLKLPAGQLHRLLGHDASPLLEGI